MEQATVILAWSRDVLKLKLVGRNSSARGEYSFKNLIFFPNPTKKDSEKSIVLEKFEMYFIEGLK